MVPEMDLVTRILDDIDQTPAPVHRPLVNLSYAQSLDGSIAARQGEMLEISGSASARLTHQLRAHHQGILVGVGTVLADDPRLTVRLAQGDDPQAVILDSKLRIPLDSALFQGRLPWIATTDQADADKVTALEAEGVRLLRTPVDSRGRVSLPDLLSCLQQLGIKKLMIEGGSGVITSFISQRLADFLVLTISPVIIGGFHAVQVPLQEIVEYSIAEFPRLEDFAVQKLGTDLILWGRLVQP